MAKRAVKNALAFGEGAAKGGATAAVVGTAIAKGVSALTRVAPVAGRVAGRAIPVVGTALLAGGAVYGGIQAHRQGKSITQGAILGSLGLDPAMAQDVKKEPPTNRERQKQLSEGVGGDPEVYRNIARNSREQMKKTKSKTERDAQERRALLAEEKFEQLTGEHIGPTRPETPAKKAEPEAVAQPDKGLLQRAKDAVFGESKPKSDALSEADKRLGAEHERIAREMADEASKGGRGPKYEKLKGDLKANEAAQAENTKKRAEREDAEAATYRSIGAIVGGAAIGVGLGSMTKRAAKKATDVAEKGIAAVAKQAGQLVKASPKGVIAGTVQGDKAAAAVATAAQAASKPTVSAVEAYGLPAANVAHGAAVYAYAEKHKDSPIANVMRAEGTAALVAGAVGFKYGMAARAMRPTVSPSDAMKLKAAANRLGREPRSGPSGVAEARGRQKVARASGAAGVEAHQARGSVKAAEAAAERRAIRGSAGVAVEKVKGGARVDVAKHQAVGDVVHAGAGAAVAKVRGAGRVERAQINVKRGNAEAIRRGEVVRGEANPAAYKDTWQDTRGRTYHRKDMSVRKGKNGPAANDNGNRAKRA